MKLDPDLIHYLTKEHFRVLTAVEMGMKNHEYVPVPLIESLAALKRGNAFKVIQFLLKHKLIMHFNKQYDGYALTYGGYDYLALKAFIKRGHIAKVLIKIGVGKESDIYLCETPEGDTVVVKFARLGRTSFRTVKENRDYLKGRANSSWLYLSRIASLKEAAFMRALFNKGFPTPTPIDANRHAIVMSHIKGYPLSQIKELDHPQAVYEQLLEQIIRLAEHGLIHGDFNEFNLMIDDNERITIIDFPQMTSTRHPNAQFYFERDVVCVQDFFERRFGLRFEGMPVLAQDVEKATELDREIRASGFDEDDLKALDTIHEHYLEQKGQEEGQESSQEEDTTQQADEEDDRERKVKFKDEELEAVGDDEESPSEEADQEDQQSNEVEGEGDATEEQKKKAAGAGKKKKLIVNEEYVKEKVKRQFWNKEKKNVAKRNRNKDKKVMKAQETIKDYFVD